MIRLTLALLLSLAAAAPVAAGISVYSPRPDAVSVTIYRDGLALITETRTVDLPAEAATVVFQGVVDTLIPQSAVVFGHERALVENNFLYDPLTPSSLIRRSVGKVVTLTRTHPQTGKATSIPVTIISAAYDRVVLQSVDGTEAFQCSGLPERLEFAEIPGELTPTPVLSIDLAAGTPGKRTMQLSYLAHGFSWQSNYVARLSERGDRMALTGWVTLKNRSNVSFKGAQIQVIAGKLNLLGDWEGGSENFGYGEDDDEQPAQEDYNADELRRVAAAARRVELLQSCLALPVPLTRSALEERRMFRSSVQNSPSAITAISEVSVTGMRVVREAFADYQLYRLPWATDLDARQTKQAVFLEKPRVKIERFYLTRLNDLEDTVDDPSPPPELVIRWENKGSSGLGEPLPAGRVRMFEPYRGSDVFAGEANIADKAVGLPVELALARALNVSVEFEQEERDVVNGVVSVTNSWHFWNGKAVPILMEVRQGSDPQWSSPVVADSNLRTGRKYGDLMWRFRVKPGQEQQLRYTLRVDQMGKRGEPE